MSDDFNARCDRLESELDSLLSPEELARIRAGETRHAPAEAEAPVVMPMQAPRLPTFFADPITGVATDLSTEDYANAAELWPLAPVSPMSRAEALRRYGSHADDCDEQEENGK